MWMWTDADIHRVERFGQRQSSRNENNDFEVLRRYLFAYGDCCREIIEASNMYEAMCKFDTLKSKDINNLSVVRMN